MSLYLYCPRDQTIVPILVQAGGFINLLIYNYFLYYVCTMSVLCLYYVCTIAKLNTGEITLVAIHDIPAILRLYYRVPL